MAQKKTQKKALNKKNFSFIWILIDLITVT